MRSRRALLLVLVGAALAGCGSDTGGRDAVPDSAAVSVEPTSVPTGLTCDGPERAAHSGGAFTEEPEGSPTREALVAASSTPERPMVLAGDRAYVLRPDGTASEVRYIDQGGRGFYFGAYEGCSPAG